MLLKPFFAFTQKWTKSFENKSDKRMLHTSNKEHWTNDYGTQLVPNYARKQERETESGLARLVWFGHVTRHNSLSKIILHTAENRKHRRFLMAPLGHGMSE